MSTSEQIFNGPEVTLLVVGSSGNGKSATGNSILGKRVFTTTAGTASDSAPLAIESSIVENVNVKVVDTPGVDTDKSPEDVLNSSIELITKAFNLCHQVFTALLIVIKYGARFTKQESDFIKTIKGILGKNVIRDSGICVITHGDNFHADNEDDGKCFEDWYKEQDGDIKKLFDECNNRCVLFNNRTKDQNISNSQVSKLLENVSKCKQYTEQDFEAAKNDLEILKIEIMAPKILKEANEFTQEKRKTIASIQAYLDLDKQVQSYMKILNEVDEFEHLLQKKYRGPDNIKDPLSVIKLLRMEINRKLKICEQSKQIKRDISTTKVNYPSRVHSEQRPSYSSSRLGPEENYIETTPYRGTEDRYKRNLRDKNCCEMLVRLICWIPLTLFGLLKRIFDLIFPTAN